MRLQSIIVKLGKTIPGPEYGGGQFANIRPEIEIGALLEPGEPLEPARDWLIAAAKASLEVATAELIGGGIKQKPTYAPSATPVPIVPVQPVQAVMPISAPPPPPVVGGIPAVDPVIF